MALVIFMKNKLFFYNTLTRKKEEFKPIGKIVGLYTCGPTVYNYAHLGNLRTYIFEDILKRTLFYNDYQVKHVMNITDVGHLTNDRDMGEDKVEMEAKKESKTAWEIANFYTKAFKNDLKKLNILEPNTWCKATDNIKEQINLIKILEKKGYTYKTSDGIYFNTAKFKDYNKLNHQTLNQLKEGARIEKNPEKKNPTDFALWKFSPKEKKRQMEWDSPWGIGFPGWHIECSAMSLKYLKNNLDIHCGGIDLINIHHTNEIAQSEAATGKKFFNFWVHGAFLNIKGGKKMAKSAENFLTLDNALTKKGINPLAFRYSTLQVHYRKPMEYTEKALKNAQGVLNNLYNIIREYDKPKIGCAEFEQKFSEAVNDDLNMPKALAVMWKLIKSNYPSSTKKQSLLVMDEVLGLGLAKIKKEKLIIPLKVKKLLQERQKARQLKNWVRADKLREQIEELDYKVEDTKEGQRLIKK